VTESFGAAAEPAAGAGRIERWFGSREFFALFNVQVVSALGDWVGFFAITSLAAAISSQPEAAIALVTTARIAPGILFTPFIGVIVDRFDRRTVMIVSDLVRAGVFVLLPLVRTVPGLVFASLLLEVFTMMWSPAKEATVPELVPPEKLTNANSLGLVAAYATMPVAGPIQYALGAVNTRLIGLGFLGFLGFAAGQGEVQTLAFYFNALSFVLAAAILWKWVFPAMTSRGRPTARVEAVADRDPMAEERSRLRRTWDEIREGWEFIFSNDVVRAVIIGLATGLIGGAMLVPLGPTFARYVIGDATTFPLFITALGLGVATGVVLLSMFQRRLPKEQVFVWLVFGSGLSMLFGVSMSNFWLAATGIFFLGLCAGSVYVLGFTLLQEHTDDDMRGRIFATLLTVVRLCVLLALLMGPFLATVFNGFADAATGADPGEVPTVGALGFDLAIPGVRLTLWLAGLIILGAGVLSARAMKMGLREGLRSAIGTVERSDASRASHPTAIVVPPRPDLPGGGWTEPPPQIVLPPPYRGAPEGELPPDVTGEIAPLDVPLARPRRRRGRGGGGDNLDGVDGGAS
jgi:dTMP kinase